MEAGEKAASVVVTARGGRGDTGGRWEEATTEVLGEGVTSPRVTT